MRVVKVNDGEKFLRQATNSWTEIVKKKHKKGGKQQETTAGIEEDAQ